jgi:hypothetical protein
VGRSSVSFRGLLFTLVAIVLVAGAVIGGYWLYVNYLSSKPEHLIARARREVQKGTEAYNADKLDVAAEHFRTADEQLGIVPSEGTAPYVSEALLLRYRAYSGLAAVVSRQEETQGPQNPPSGRLMAQARQCARRAHKANPENVEAVAVLFDDCFRSDLISQAEPFAETLVKFKPEDYSQD